MPSWVTETESKECSQERFSVKVLEAMAALSVRHVYRRAELAPDRRDGKVMAHGACNSFLLPVSIWQTQLGFGANTHSNTASVRSALTEALCCVIVCLARGRGRQSTRDKPHPPCPSLSSLLQASSDFINDQSPAVDLSASTAVVPYPVRAHWPLLTSFPL